MIKITFIKKTIGTLHFAIWQNWCFGQIIQELKFWKIAQFLGGRPFERIKDLFYKIIWALEFREVGLALRQKKLKTFEHYNYA